MYFIAISIIEFQFNDYDCTIIKNNYNHTFTAKAHFVKFTGSEFQYVSFKRCKSERLWYFHYCNFCKVLQSFRVVYRAKRGGKLLMLTFSTTNWPNI